MARILRCCGSGVGRLATPPIGPLAWEPPYAVGEALEMAKRLTLPPPHTQKKRRQFWKPQNEAFTVQSKIRPIVFR